MSDQKARTGGCQCGAVRFRIEGAMGRPSVCHCRMCQKASGNFYLPLVSVVDAHLTWTRGAPKRFRSSNAVLRGFCADCGTPLTFEAPEGVALAIGAFDDPATLAPGIQWGTEAKLPYVDGISGLPEQETMEDISEASYLADMTSFQHPDHDTHTWPPETKP